jgi:O-Antigen ligase
MNWRASIVLEDSLSYKMFHRPPTLESPPAASQSEQNVNFRRMSRGPGKGSSANSGKTRQRGRTIALYFALGLVFARFSLIHEVLSHSLGINLYPLYVFGIPAIAGVLFTGGLRRAFRFKPAIYWTCFALWLLPATVFSVWKGGSVALIEVYYRTDFIMLFIIAGLAVSWRECRLLIFTIAAAASTTLGLLIAFGEKDINGRTTLKFGAVANSNDYAGHLLLLLPFLLWVVMSSKSKALRIISLPVLGFGMYQILASASRGAMLGTVAGIIVYLVTAPSKQRKIALIAIPAVLIISFAVLPHAVVQRMFSFSDKSASSSAEAMESSHIRERLLQDSILETLKHPIFGVGPGDFSVVEGTKHLAGLGIVLWYQTHNSYTAASSEAGLPGLAFMLAGILSTVFLLNRIARVSRSKPGFAEVRNAVFCLRLSVASFCTAIFFLNFAYSFYLPALAGLAIAMALGTRDLLASHKAPVPPTQVVETAPAPNA